MEFDSELDKCYGLRSRLGGRTNVTWGKMWGNSTVVTGLLDFFPLLRRVNYSRRIGFFYLQEQLNTVSQTGVLAPFIGNNCKHFIRVLARSFMGPLGVDHVAQYQANFIRSLVLCSVDHARSIPAGGLPVPWHQHAWTHHTFLSVRYN